MYFLKRIFKNSPFIPFKVNNQMKEAYKNLLNDSDLIIRHFYKENDDKINPLK